MTNQAPQITHKLWKYCNVLPDDGMSYGDYPSAELRASVEQLTYLLFLKMADERATPPYTHENSIPSVYNWQSLLTTDGEDLLSHYRQTLGEPGNKRDYLD